MNKVLTQFQLITGLFPTQIALNVQLTDIECNVLYVFRSSPDPLVVVEEAVNLIVLFPHDFGSNQFMIMYTKMAETVVRMSI